MDEWVTDSLILEILYVSKTEEGGGVVVNTYKTRVTIIGFVNIRNEPDWSPREMQTCLPTFWTGLPTF